MKLGLRQCLAVAALAALVGCGAADAAQGGWESLVDPTYGIRVAMPKTWDVVPPTVAGVQSLIAQLEKKKETGLAAAYSGLIDTAAARTKLSSYHFQAFQYVPSAQVEPDFTLAFARTSRAFTVKDLTAIAKSNAKAFASRGVTVTKATVVTLPAGPAALTEGTATVGIGVTVHLEDFVIAHGTLLYQLSFEADASIAGSGATFTEIARRFAFV